MQVTDAMGTTITFTAVPRRIVSVVPSLTELLYALDLDEEVVGITKFCVHPVQWHQTKTRIGGTKNPNIETIKNLHPQIVIASKEENTADDVAALRRFVPVYVTDVKDLPTAQEAITAIASILDREEKGAALCKQIAVAFDALPSFAQLSAVYLIWQEPMMTVGGDTFIHSMMQHCGLKNSLADAQRYPQLTEEALVALSPKVLLLSSEPYPFKEKHVAHFKSLLPKTKVVLADGEMFSWYGSRLLHAPDYFKRLRKTLD